LANEFNRFEITRKGYEPQAVERELRELNLELVRLTEQNGDLTERLRSTKLQLSQSEAALEASKSPNFAALGSKAATILSNAQQIAAELELDAKTISDQLLEGAKDEAAQVREAAQKHYDSVVAEAARRAARSLSAAEQDSVRVVQRAKEDAERLVREAELEAARIRGSVATEVAGIRAAAKREAALLVEQTRAEQTAREALWLSDELSGAEKLSAAQQKKLDAALALRRAEAEAEYLEKHREAAMQTESYLTSAAEDMRELTTRISQLRFEIETLELEATSTQKRMLREARERADGIIASAEAEARDLTATATKQASESARKAQDELVILQNQAAAIEIYLENLRSLVTTELSRRSDGIQSKAD
jgi:cell division septum initiation protein DivIVA